MRHLQNLINQLESYIPDLEITNPAVSQSTIGWQIDHSLLVINRVIDQVKNSKPENYKWKFNKWRIIIQMRNSIPRGKVRVPKSVKPTDVPTIEELQYRLNLAKNNISLLETLPDKSYFTHPIFGDLKLKTTIWFLTLHTNHHLKIIIDILKTKNPET